MPIDLLPQEEIVRRLRLIASTDPSLRCGRKVPGIGTVARIAQVGRTRLHSLAMGTEPIGKATQRKLSIVLQSLNAS